MYSLILIRKIDRPRLNLKRDGSILCHSVQELIPKHQTFRNSITELFTRQLNYPFDNYIVQTQTKWFQRRTLLDCNAFRQVTRLIDVTATPYRDVVGQKLQR
jgi:hypothetical protein